MVLGKRWLFSIGNGAEIRPLKNGRKCSVMTYSAGCMLNTILNFVGSSTDILEAQDLWIFGVTENINQLFFIIAISRFLTFHRWFNDSSIHFYWFFTEKIIIL